MNQVYLDTARLMTRVAPLVFADDIFALKGGTAINLFLRDMPRLSVDLDLVFVDRHLSRDKALGSINAAIRKAAGRLEANGFRTQITTAAEVGETKLFVRRDNIQLKVEVNFVTRGTVYPVQTASLTSKAKEVLLADLELPLLSLEEVYGSKLVAALDRQHPRDLFDVAQLFEHEGITPGIRRVFVVYLASHNRPIHEVLFPAKRDIAQDYERTFKGMTIEPVELAELLSTRDRLILELQENLRPEERQFLLSLVNAEPDWNLQLAKNNPTKFRDQADELARRLKLPLG